MRKLSSKELSRRSLMKSAVAVSAAGASVAIFTELSPKVGDGLIF